jgi:subtilisin family serine protease
LCLALLVGAAGAVHAAAADTVIVRLAPGALIRPVTDLLGGQILDEIPEARTYLISVPALPPLWLPIPGIEYIEPNALLTLPAVLESGILTGSPETSAHWYLAQPSLQRVRASDALEVARGRGVVVADIDARFDRAHPALEGRLTGGFDFVEERKRREAGLDQSSASFLFDGSGGSLDQSSASFMFGENGLLDQSSASFMFGENGLLDQSSASFMFGENGLLDQSSASFLFDENGLRFLSPFVRLLEPPEAALSHGTLTAGLIAVTAPEARIMPIRAFDDQGQADLFTLARSIRYAASNGADVINMSWGTLGDSRALRDAIRFASGKGIVLVTSAGNMNSDVDVYPAAYPGVIAVAATDDLDRKAAFSNFGSNIDVSAPGVNVISAYPGGYYASASGTSFSAPIVAGEAALLKSLGSPESNIPGSAVNIDRTNPHWTGKMGAGRIDMLEAVRPTRSATPAPTAPIRLRRLHLW